MRHEKKKGGRSKAGDEGRGPVILQGPSSVGSSWQQSNQTQDSVLKGRGYKTRAHTHTRRHIKHKFSHTSGDTGEAFARINANTAEEMQNVHIKGSDCCRRYTRYKNAT